MDRRRRRHIRRHRREGSRGPKPTRPFPSESLSASPLSLSFPLFFLSFPLFFLSFSCCYPKIRPTGIYRGNLFRDRNTSAHEHWHIHCSSRTPRSLAYTQHPDRVSAHIAIAFTRHPDSSLTHHNPTHTTQTHFTYTHHIHMSKPKAGKRPVPSCHPSPTLSQTVRQLQHHFSVAKSVTSTARQDVSMHRCDWKHNAPIDAGFMSLAV